MQLEGRSPEQTIAILAGALDYYARDANYRSRTLQRYPKSPNVLSDRGKRARKALEATGLKRR